MITGSITPKALSNAPGGPEETVPQAVKVPA